MKKKFITCALAGLATLSLVACAPFDAAGTVATFEDSIDTTVKLNYDVNYDVNVTREGGINEGFYKFIHKIRAKSVIEMDLGEDLYIKTSKEWQDLFVSEEKTKTESILYKKEGKYYYQSSSSVAVEVPADKVQEKLETILTETTYEDAGAITLEALLYNNLDKEYEYNVIGQTNGAYEIEDQVDPEYSGNDNGGLHVVYKPEYVGYKTDMGMSDFSNTDDGYAAEVVIDTNDKGYVTSFSETYNSAMLDFAIMEPKPRVTITGSRSFTASYGEELTRAESVPFAPSKAVFEQNENGVVAVYTCNPDEWTNMVEVKNGEALEMGKYVCIKVTPASGYAVDSVSLNGNANAIVQAGYYCFTVVPGDNNIAVKLKALEPLYVTVNIATPENGSVKVTYLDFNNGGPAAPQTEITTGGKVDANAGNMWIMFTVTPAEGYVLDKITVNGNPAVNYNVWLYELKDKTVTEYNVVVTFKSTK